MAARLEAPFDDSLERRPALAALEKLCHFRLGPFTRSGPSHRGQPVGENAKATIIPELFLRSPAISVISVKQSLSDENRVSPIRDISSCLHNWRAARYFCRSSLLIAAETASECRRPRATLRTCSTVTLSLVATRLYMVWSFALLRLYQV